MSLSDVLFSPLRRFYTFVLKKLIGEYLKDELNHSQLEVELRKGILQLTDIELDTEVLNESIDGLPLEIVSARVDRIQTEIPWHSLSARNCKITLKGLQIIVKPIDDNRFSAHKMSESFIIEASRAALKEEDMSAFVKQHLKSSRSRRQTSPLPAEEAEDDVDAEAMSTVGMQVIGNKLKEVLEKTEFFAEDCVICFEHENGSPDKRSRVNLHLSSVQYINKDALATTSTDKMPHSEPNKFQDTTERETASEAKHRSTYAPEDAAEGGGLLKQLRFRGLRIDLVEDIDEDTDPITIGHGEIDNYCVFQLTLPPLVPSEDSPAEPQAHRRGETRIDCQGKLPALRMLVGPHQLKHILTAVKEMGKSSKVLAKRMRALKEIEDDSTVDDSVHINPKRARKETSSENFDDLLQETRQSFNNRQHLHPHSNSHSQSHSRSLSPYHDTPLTHTSAPRSTTAHTGNFGKPIKASDYKTVESLLHHYTPSSTNHPRAMADSFASIVSHATDTSDQFFDCNSGSMMSQQRRGETDFDQSHSYSQSHSQHPSAGAMPSVSLGVEEHQHDHKHKYTHDSKRKKQLATKSMVTWKATINVQRITIILLEEDVSPETWPADTEWYLTPIPLPKSEQHTESSSEIEHPLQSSPRTTEKNTETSQPKDIAAPASVLSLGRDHLVAHLDGVWVTAEQNPSRPWSEVSVVTMRLYEFVKDNANQHDSKTTFGFGGYLPTRDGDRYRCNKVLSFASALDTMGVGVKDDGGGLGGVDMKGCESDDDDSSHDVQLESVRFKSERRDYYRELSERGDAFDTKEQSRLYTKLESCSDTTGGPAPAGTDEKHRLSLLDVSLDDDDDDAKGRRRHTTNCNDITDKHANQDGKVFSPKSDRSFDDMKTARTGVTETETVSEIMHSQKPATERIQQKLRRTEKKLNPDFRMTVCDVEVDVDEDELGNLKGKSGSGGSQIDIVTLPMRVSADVGTIQRMKRLQKLLLGPGHVNEGGTDFDNGASSQFELRSPSSSAGLVAGNDSHEIDSELGSLSDGSHLDLNDVRGEQEQIRLYNSTAIGGNPNNPNSSSLDTPATKDKPKIKVQIPHVLFVCHKSDMPSALSLRLDATKLLVSNEPIAAASQSRTETDDVRRRTRQNTTGDSPSWAFMFASLKGNLLGPKRDNKQHHDHMFDIRDLKLSVTSRSANSADSTIFHPFLAPGTKISARETEAFFQRLWDPYRVWEPTWRAAEDDERGEAKVKSEASKSQTHYSNSADREKKLADDQGKNRNKNLNNRGKKSAHTPGGWARANSMGKQQSERFGGGRRRGKNKPNEAKSLAEFEQSCKAKANTSVDLHAHHCSIAMTRPMYLRFLGFVKDIASALGDKKKKQQQQENAKPNDNFDEKHTRTRRSHKMPAPIVEDLTVSQFFKPKPDPSLLPQHPDHVPTPPRIPDIQVNVSRKKILAAYHHGLALSASVNTLVLKIKQTQPNPTQLNHPRAKTHQEFELTVRKFRGFHLLGFNNDDTNYTSMALSDVQLLAMKVDSAGVAESYPVLFNTLAGDAGKTKRNGRKQYQRYHHTAKHSEHKHKQQTRQMRNIYSHDHIVQLVHVSSSSQSQGQSQTHNHQEDVQPTETQVQTAVNFNAVTLEVSNAQHVGQWAGQIRDFFASSSRETTQLNPNSNPKQQPKVYPAANVYVHATDCAVDYNPPSILERGVLVFTRISMRVCDEGGPAASSHITVDLSDLRGYVTPESPKLDPCKEAQHALWAVQRRKDKGEGLLPLLLQPYAKDSRKPLTHLHKLRSSHLITYLEHVGFVRVASIDAFQMCVQLSPKTTKAKQQLLDSNPLVPDTTVELTRGVLSIQVCADSCAALTTLAASIVTELTPVEQPQEVEVSFQTPLPTQNEDGQGGAADNNGGSSSSRRRPASLLNSIDHDAFKPDPSNNPKPRSPVQAAMLAEAKEAYQRSSRASSLSPHNDQSLGGIQNYFQGEGRKQAASLRRPKSELDDNSENESAGLWSAPLTIVENHFVFRSETDRIYKAKLLHPPRSHPRPKLTFKMHSVKARLKLFGGHDFTNTSASQQRRMQHQEPVRGQAQAQVQAQAQAQSSACRSEFTASDRKREVSGSGGPEIGEDSQNNQGSNTLLLPKGQADAHAHAHARANRRSSSSRSRSVASKGSGRSAGTHKHSAASTKSNNSNSNSINVHSVVGYNHTHSHSHSHSHSPSHHHYNHPNHIDVGGQRRPSSSSSRLSNNNNNSINNNNNNKLQTVLIRSTHGEEEDDDADDAKAGLNAFVQDTYLQPETSQFSDSDSKRSRSRRSGAGAGFGDSFACGFGGEGGGAGEAQQDAGVVGKACETKTRLSSQRVEAELSGIHMVLNLYSKTSRVASYFAVTVDDVDVTDMVQTSDFATLRLLSYEKPKNHLRESGSSMVRLKITNVRTDSDRNPDRQEARVGVSVLPVRIKLDQDTVEFMFGFLKSLARSDAQRPSSTTRSSTHTPSTSQPPSQSAGSAGSGNATRNATATHNISSHLPDDTDAKGPPQTYIQSFKIDECNICLDYIPKRIDLDALRTGEYAQLAHLLRLEEVRITLASRLLRAVEGWGGVAARLGKDWADQILAQQLHRCLAGIQPLRSLIKVGSGVVDLVILPIEQFRKDGRVFKGLSDGVSALVKSVTIETINVATTLAIGAHSLLDTVDGAIGSKSKRDMAGESGSRSASNRNNERKGGGGGGRGRRGSSAPPQPRGLRDGLQQAYDAFSGGMKDAARKIVIVPSSKLNAGEYKGAVSSVVKAVPSAVISSMSGVTKGVSKVLIGAKNQADPSADHNRNQSK